MRWIAAAIQARGKARQGIGRDRIGAMPPTADSSPVVPVIRLRAAAIITRADQVLLHRAEGDLFWALPGGGIEPGESAAQALVREMQEELGLAVVPGALACVVENFFAYAGVAFHETGLYLHATPEPGSVLDRSAGPYQGAEGHRALEFAWFARAAVADLDLRPDFLRGALKTLGQDGHRVLHVVHRDAPPVASPLARPASPEKGSL